jgi:Flp pilus assembly protein TadD
LIIRLPGLSRRVVAQPVRHIDIVPTVLDALGMDVPKDLPGRSLWNLVLGGAPSEGFSSYFESLSTSLNQGWAPLRGALDPRYKYIDLPLPELYDLQSDPTESKNLVASEPERLESMRRALARLRADDRGVKRGGEDAATIERLRALGYVGAAQAAPQKERYTAADDPKNLIAFDTRNREVVTLFMAGRLDDAVALAKANLKERPDMAGANLQLAYLERARGNLAAAVAAARRAVFLKPLDAEAVSLLGAYLTELGRPREAIASLEPYVKVTAPDFDILTALGLAYSAAGRLPEARETFVKARETDPSNPAGLVNLGTLELMAGNRDAARGTLEQALELDASIAKAHNTLGVMAAQEGRLPEAIARWRRAVELNPNDYQTLFNLATTLEKQGDLAGARANLEAYVRVAPPALEGKDIGWAKAWLSRH